MILQQIWFHEMRERKREGGREREGEGERERELGHLEEKLGHS
jgi:hypothetical protein